MARKALLIALALMLALAVPALAQKKTGDKSPTPLASSPADAAKGHGEVTNFGQRWTAMTDKERNSFLEGVVSAFRIVCLNVAMGGPDTSKNPKDMQKNFMDCFLAQFPYQSYMVKEAMTSLYQDKANNIIPFDIMYGMALLKVKGDPVEDNLVKLRQDLNRRGK
jgi:hypothetical protein